MCYKWCYMCYISIHLKCATNGFNYLVAIGGVLEGGGGVLLVVDGGGLQLPVVEAVEEHLGQVKDHSQLFVLFFF